MKTFKIEGQVFVSDPCYDTSVWCTTILENVKPGVYNSMVNRFEGRISELLVFHESVDPESLKFTWVDARIGVDSGQCGVYDLKEFARQKEMDLHLDEVYDKMPFYDQVCEQTLSEEGWGVLKFGVTASAGYGDGVYDLFTAEKDGKIVAMKLVFISEDEDEEFEEL